MLIFSSYIPKINCLVYSLHFETTGLAEINELLNQMAKKVTTNTI